MNAEDVDDDECNKSKILVMLHVDAIYEVFKRLSPRDLVRVSTVCKKWHITCNTRRRVCGSRTANARFDFST